MKNESNTLFIPLYGKAIMSQEGFLSDPTAESIVKNEPDRFKHVDTSKRLAIYMAMRARQFDTMTECFLRHNPGAIVIHTGCGLDARCRRVETKPAMWYDLDFPDVIALRKRYFKETSTYRMLPFSVTDPTWMDAVSYDGQPILIIAEGLTMYLTEAELQALFRSIRSRFKRALFLFDAYSNTAAKISKFRNPVNAMKAKVTFGMTNPSCFENPSEGICCVCDRDIILPKYINKLEGMYHYRFRLMRHLGADLYRIYGYEFCDHQKRRRIT